MQSQRLIAANRWSQKITAYRFDLGNQFGNPGEFSRRVYTDSIERASQLAIACVMRNVVLQKWDKIYVGRSVSYNGQSMLAPNGTVAYIYDGNALQPC